MRTNIQFEDVMIFRNDYNGRAFYSLGVSSRKYENGQVLDERITAYLNIQFQRGSEPFNQQRIDITRAFFGAYPDKNGKGQLKLIVQEWTPHEDDGRPY